MMSWNEFYKLSIVIFWITQKPFSTIALQLASDGLQKKETFWTYLAICKGSGN